MKRIVWLLLATACGGPWDEVSFVDEGQLCFSTQSDGIAVEVQAPDCLSSSCSRDPHGTCEATIDGERITITSEFHWEERNGGIKGCTLDCGRVVADCTLAGLAPGTYTVVHGEEEVELVVPLAQEGCPL
ncbi:MAG TPA: hypothetical protein VG755_13835 [Nannocystaceae bacterium]|nr:hypothetical protein [Nannocystaceae bacterium]